MIPEKHRDEKTKDGNEQETDYRFQQCDAGMPEKGRIQNHLIQVFHDRSRRAEKEDIDISGLRRIFPEEQKEQKNQQTEKGNSVVVFPVSQDKSFLVRQVSFGFLVLRDHLTTPSIKD